MRISAELQDHEAAGSLADELPYWGWLEDGRTCLTRSGELIAAGRLVPAGGRRAFARADRPRARPLAAPPLGPRRRHTPLLLYAPPAEGTRGRGRRRLRHRSGLAAEAPRVSGRPRAAARGLPGLGAQSQATDGGGRARVGTSVPSHAVVEAQEGERADLPRFRDRGGRCPLPGSGGRGPGARRGAHADRDARGRRGFPAPLRADQPSATYRFQYNPYVSDKVL